MVLLIHLILCQNGEFFTYKSLTTFEYEKNTDEKILFSHHIVEWCSNIYRMIEIKYNDNDTTHNAIHIERALHPYFPQYYIELTQLHNLCVSDYIDGDIIGMRAILTSSSFPYHAFIHYFIHVTHYIS